MIESSEVTVGDVEVGEGGMVWIIVFGAHRQPGGMWRAEVQGDQPPVFLVTGNEIDRFCGQNVLGKAFKLLRLAVLLQGGIIRGPTTCSMSHKVIVTEIRWVKGVRNAKVPFTN